MKYMYPAYSIFCFQFHILFCTSYIADNISLALMSIFNLPIMLDTSDTNHDYVTINLAFVIMYK